MSVFLRRLAIDRLTTEQPKHSDGQGMNWHDIGEVIKVLGAAATAVAAWFAASIAYRGLEKWRGETSGKRRAELAEKVLANVYEMAEILRSARSPFVMNHERGKLEGVPDEIAANSNFAPERRLLEHQDFFGRFRSLKHEFAAVFGVNAAEFFDELWKIRLRINNAVDSMLRTPEIGKSRDPDDRKLWQEWYYTAFRNSNETNDETLKQIKQQVSNAEAVCRPAIEIRAASQR